MAYTKRVKYKPLVTSPVKKFTPKTMHDKIAEKLAKGENVYSQAAGRVGKVMAVDANVIRISRARPSSPKHYMFVTTFNSGDKVRLVKRIVTEWVIENV